MPNRSSPTWLITHQQVAFGTFFELFWGQVAKAGVMMGCWAVSLRGLVGHGGQKKALGFLEWTSCNC